MLTARGRPEDVLRGFEAGADDYLPKPFELPILLARVRGLLRRGMAAAGRRTARGRHVRRQTIDFEPLELRVGDKKYQLTLMEPTCCGISCSTKAAVSRKAILEDVWGLHEDTDTRAIDNFIVRSAATSKLTPPNPSISSQLEALATNSCQNRCAC